MCTARALAAILILEQDYITWTTQRASQDEVPINIGDVACTVVVVRCQ